MEAIRNPNTVIVPKISFECYHDVQQHFLDARSLLQCVSQTNEFAVASGMPVNSFIGAAVLVERGGVKIFQSAPSTSEYDNAISDAVFIPRMLPPEIQQLLENGLVSMLIMGGNLVRADREDTRRLLSLSPKTEWFTHPKDNSWAQMIMGFDPISNIIQYGYTNL
ncbi:hypothetical protein COV58_01585 [Candidatus Roizmanbacteria bacterium CG11_big_fil_rev_8_21_14_0_20_36_8]|uniref:Uncharacterized protein n=2 Tax=Candidatus Roizmaniibacteriota TaxID=1752723 RepID=A0A2M6IUI7_9BACT|nr:MAG: hypothetical protein COV58_01585 [Candidatus Roizmanbacteria bacterium CG11_big_fil_rev_8_21_14_0_20_36_8]PIZ65943.1 MAG: hypothetical protein COY14_01345 [Candidatus Roizmanbacteria bacterium CG_4_10_14_0_2_um_filter_36_9]